MAEPTIEWVQSKRLPDLVHGMVRGLRAFTLDRAQRPYELQCHLPGPLGGQFIQRLSSEAEAHEKAEQMLVAFLIPLTAPEIRRN